VKKHDIRTLRDILEVVDDKNIDYFIKDFSDWLYILVIVAKLDKTQIEVNNADIFTWIDDKKNNVHVSFSKKKQGEE